MVEDLDEGIVAHSWLQVVVTDLVRHMFLSLCSTFKPIDCSWIGLIVLIIDGTQNLGQEDLDLGLTIWIILSGGSQNRYCLCLTIGLCGGICFCRLGRSYDPLVSGTVRVFFGVLRSGGRFRIS